MSDIPETPKSRRQYDQPDDLKMSEVPETPKASVDREVKGHRDPFWFLIRPTNIDHIIHPDHSPLIAQPTQLEEEDFDLDGGDLPQIPNTSVNRQFKRRGAPFRLLTAADFPETEHAFLFAPSPFLAEPKEREEDNFLDDEDFRLARASLGPRYKSDWEKKMEYYQDAMENAFGCVDRKIYKIGEDYLKKFGITFWEAVICVLYLLFALCVVILVTSPYSQNSMPNKVQRIVDYNNISDRDTVSTLSLTGQWANGQLNESLIISLVGISDKLFPVMDSLTTSVASAVGQNNGDMLFLNEDMSRTDIHQLFMAAHSENGKTNSTVIALYNAEKKSEDILVILRRIYDHRDPVFHRTLILLGVVVDKMHIENCIKDSLNRYLSFQCLADDFPFNVAPFVHLPSVRTIFI